MAMRLKTSTIVPVMWTKQEWETKEKQQEEEGKGKNTICKIIDKVASLQFKEDTKLEKKLQKRETKVTKLAQKLGATRLQPEYRLPYVIVATFHMEITLKENYSLFKVYNYTMCSTPSETLYLEKRPTSFSLLPTTRSSAYRFSNRDSFTAAESSTLPVGDRATLPADCREHLSARDREHSTDQSISKTYTISFYPSSNGLCWFYVKSHHYRILAVQQDTEKVFCRQSVFVPFAIDLENLYPTRKVKSFGNSFGIVVSEESRLIFMTFSEKNSIMILNDKGEFHMLCDSLPGPSGLALTFDGSLIVIGNMGIYKLSFSLSELGEEERKEEWKSKESDVINGDKEEEINESEIFEGQQERERFENETTVFRGAKIKTFLSYPHNDFTGIAISPIDGCVYIVQREKCCVSIFTSDLVLLRSFGRRGNELFGKLGDFQCPYGIAIDDHGTVYVTDCCAEGYAQGGWNSGEIYMFYSSGQYMNHIHCDKFVPLGITISPGGLIYVTSQRHNIVVLTRFGQFVRHINVINNSSAIALHYDMGTLAYTTSNSVVVYDGQLPSRMIKMPDL